MGAHKSDIVNTKNHPWLGVRWPVKGSTGNKYIVTILNSGFDCDCMAYRKCKHIKEVEAKFEDVE